MACSYKFGDFVLKFIDDKVGWVLSKSGEPVRLARLNAKGLSVLLETQGNPVSTGDIIRLVWQNDDKGKGKDENNVHVMINAVRKALEDEDGKIISFKTDDSYRVKIHVKVIDNIDHICQLAGNTHHVAIGSDLDGAFGKEQCPYDIETIADLQKIPVLLKERGYLHESIDNIMHGNWLRFLRKAWSR